MIYFNIYISINSKDSLKSLLLKYIKITNGGINCIYTIFILIFIFHVLYIKIFISILNFLYSYINKFPIIESKISEKKDDVTGQNKVECESFKETISKSLKKNDDSFSTKCKQIAEHQGDIIKDTDSSKPALCKYINYWFYGLLKETDPKDQYNLLSNFYDGVQSLKDCKTYQKSIKKEEYDEVKELYEMYKEFNNFKEKSLQQGNTTCDDLTNCVKIYNKYLEGCNTVYKHGLCMNVKNFKYEYDDHRKIAKSCVEKMEELKLLRTYLESIILLPFVLMTLITFILIYLYKVNKNTVKKIFNTL
ncbi:hypothetical protein PVBG_05902 [Plasmodium vivax Brazil I]|uniref:Uncharacterized protein n=1 Tax=Plasmodium vivax (strain Brazil I) TaxID=1033975 RepID=A0A0J9SJS2_PLAV1|nr:hypothetical protein PVBG_05902 [Plasmodium vivax Brazil I]